MTLEMILIGLCSATTALWIRAEIAGAFKTPVMAKEKKQRRPQVPEIGTSEPQELPDFLAALKSLDIPEKQARQLWTRVENCGTIEDKITAALKVQSQAMRNQ